MKTNFLKRHEVNHRAELACVHHRMMLRARQRARYGRWWWEQARRLHEDRLKPGLHTRLI